MNKPRILVVEDDNSVKNLITTTLKPHDYHFLTAENGEVAILEAASHNPEIMLLDLGLPDIDGIEVIKRVRTWSQMPIIVISARSEDVDKIEALDAGADDYLTKPFSAVELLARIRVALRHLCRLGIGGQRVQTTAKVKDLSIDFEKHLVYLEGKEIHVTPMEYSLLNLFFHNIGKVLTTSYILKEVYGVHYGTDTQALRALMAGLRRKIEKNPEKPQYILTEIGVGYRLSEN